ncbi:hypothetical protein [Rhizobium miluonense]|uniref:Uncharacterized protein n=1 Tax=Rhizobium miluonense TaxID=411945 RepID=A0ABU1SR80_9HYPH|nr:hypothetical protein [Rhizobium miluonense]MDR6901472.1 hypothetical protein [Rhizobium miluonense]
MSDTIEIDVPYAVFAKDFPEMAKAVKELAIGLGLALETDSAGKAILNGMRGVPPSALGAALKGALGPDDLVALAVDRVLQAQDHKNHYADLMLEYYDYKRQVGGDINDAKFNLRAFAHLLATHTNYSMSDIEKIVNSAIQARGQLPDIRATERGVTLTFHLKGPETGPDHQNTAPGPSQVLHRAFRTPLMQCSEISATHPRRLIQLA